MGVIHLKSNVSLKANGATIIKNKYKKGAGVIFSAEGSIGKEVPISKNVSKGAIAISTKTNHKFKINDLILIKSQRNALSPDASQYRMGSPTAGFGAFFAEFLHVTSIDTKKSFSIYPPLEQSHYRTDRTEETTKEVKQKVHNKPRRSTTVAKVNPIQHITIEGFTFDATKGSTFTAVRLHTAAHIKVNNCTAIYQNKTGHFVKAVKSYQITISNSNIIHSASIWKNIKNHAGKYYRFNSMVLAGCHYCTVRNCSDVNGAQTVDIGYAPNDITGSNCTVMGSHFSHNFYNPVTTHPGVYRTSILSNVFDTCRVGLQLRTPYLTVSNNVISGFSQNGLFIDKRYKSSGIALLGNIQHSTITNNTISGFQRGIFITDHTNRVTFPAFFNTTISNNNISNCQYGFYARGNKKSSILQDNGLIVQNNIYRDIIKTPIFIAAHLSGVVIDNNLIYGGFQEESAIEAGNKNVIIIENKLIDPKKDQSPIHIQDIPSDKRSYMIKR